MAADDIYVQITADSAGRSRSVIVLVSKAVRESVKGMVPNENMAAQKLAEPLANYAFSHRRVFENCKVSYAFYPEEPNEIKGKAPQLTQNGLKAWII